MVQAKPSNRAGYVSTENGESRYYVFPQIFKTEICRGIDHKLGLKALAGKNLLITDSGRISISRQAPGAAKNSRFYCILGSVISEA